MTIGSNAHTAPFYILGAGICWGLIGLFSRHLAALGYSPVQITFGRAMVTAIVMVLWMAQRHRADLCIAKRDIWMFLGTGLCSIVFFNICYFTAISLTTLSMAAILLYTAPSIVMIFSVILFKERFTPRKACCLVLAFIGCALVSGIGSGAINVLGILAGLGSGLGYALYSIFGRYALRKYTPFTVTTWTFIIASMGLLGFCHVDIMAETAVLHPLAVVWLILLGLISTTVPFVLYTQGLQHMDAGKASIIASIEPLTSTVIGVAVFQETLTLIGGIGILCIISAVVLLNQGKS